MSATIMKLFLQVGFSLLLYDEIEGITTHSVTGCSDYVLLNCSITEMIHVERITYYNGTDCNQAVTDLQDCGQPMTGSDTGLSPACNGKVTCNEVLYYSYCPGSKAARVDYKCIPRSNVKDMCDTFIIGNTNRIFLSTPNFPSRPTFTDISSCRCFIRGSNITSIQILDLVLTSTPDGTKSSLEINYGDVTYTTESLNDSTRRVYNKRLSTTSTTAEITLNHNGINRQYLWIEVQGVSMFCACTTAQAPASTKLPTTTTTTKTSTIAPTPSSSSSTAFPVSSLPASTESASQTELFTSKHNQDNDKDRQTIIAVSVVLSLCLLLICIAVIVVCILFKKGKLAWVKKPARVERETDQELTTRNLRSSEEGERNPYSGLDQAQRVSGNDGTYQELNTRNSTPQYNNVSQNTLNHYYNLN